ncbi:hypothetical protein IWW48_002841 [Coemansia sp. RSA 1200]|nr:hypothetical protein IWW48_002841 [Coemansia sp. RSA 1200]
MTTITDLNVDELQKMKRKQLQTLCKKNGIKANGKNEELIEQLLETTKADDGLDCNASIEKKDEGTESSDIESGNQAEDTNGSLYGTPESQAQEDTDCADKPQFSSVAEQVIAEMETRALSLADSQRKDAIKQYNATRNIVEETPRKAMTSGKTTVFDKAHDKIFGDDDSIVNHWSARKTPVKTTPNNKRPKPDESTLDTNKRPRFEVLFASPKVVKAKNQESAHVKAMTSKVQRTQAPRISASSAGGSRTAIHDNRSISVDLNGVSPTTLFVNKSQEKMEEKAPVLSTESIISTANTEEATECGVSQEKGELPTETGFVPELNASESIPIAESSTTSSESAITNDKKQSPDAQPPPSANKPLVASESQEIDMPKALLATDATTLPSNTMNSADTTKAAKQSTDQKQPANAANYRNVESKIKAYINSKPSEPKVKALKQSGGRINKPAPLKSATKRLASAAPMRNKNRAAKQLKTTSDERNSTPSYMRATRATENRANKANISTRLEKQKPLEKGAVATNKSTNTNSRTKPYNPPSNVSSKLAE